MYFEIINEEATYLGRSYDNFAIFTIVHGDGIDVIQKENVTIATIPDDELVPIDLTGRLD